MLWTKYHIIVLLHVRFYNATRFVIAINPPTRYITYVRCQPCTFANNFDGFCSTQGPQFNTALWPTGMMTSSNGNIFRVTGHLCGEFSGDRWIPRTKASDAGLWSFFLICAWINGWGNNREGCNLRRHRAHYNVTVMSDVSAIHYEVLVPSRILNSVLPYRLRNLPEC